MAESNIRFSHLSSHTKPAGYPYPTLSVDHHQPSDSGPPHTTKFTTNKYFRPRILASRGDQWWIRVTEVPQRSKLGEWEKLLSCTSSWSLTRNSVRCYMFFNRYLKSNRRFHLLKVRNIPSPILKPPQRGISDFRQEWQSYNSRSCSHIPMKPCAFLWVLRG